MILFAGALLGLISVAFGAYAEHGLQASLSPDAFDSVRTAIWYNQIHAVVVTVIGLVRLRAPGPSGSPAIEWAAWGFVAGTVLFCFSIYLSAVTGVPGIRAAAPFGGMALMAGWVALGWAGIRGSH